MSLVKDLLLLLVTIMHISLMVSSPVRLQSCEEKLGLQAAYKQYFSSLLKDLSHAETVFTEQVLHNTTRKVKTRSPKLLEGIAIPAGNMNVSNVLNSMYEISECLTSYLPKAVGNVSMHEDVKTVILSSTSPFLIPFRDLAPKMKDCWEEGELKVCPKHLANNQTHYEMKLYTLDVLHTAVKWTQSYIQRTGDQ